MNDSLHIQQRLRTLLERFYDGSTSPEEEREINRLLSSAECQTEEFAADSRLFAALTAPTADTPPPPALGEKLEKMAAGHFRPHHLTPPVWLRWGAAAAILLGVALTLPLRHTDSPADTAQAPLTAQALPPAVTIKAETQPVEDTAVAPPAPEPRRQRHRPAATAATPAPATDDAAADDTDTYLSPEQAARISEAALMTMARTLASADGVCRQTDERIGSTISSTLGLLPAAINSPTNNI